MFDNEVFAAESTGKGLGIKRVLELINVFEEACRAKSIIVKVNFVSACTLLSATPVEAVEEYIKYLRDFCRKKVVIAEAPAVGGSFRDALDRFGYYRLKDYDVEFLDLSGDDYEEFYVWNRNLDRNVKVKVSKTMLESDYLVSIVRPKTHDTVIATLTIKNVVVGAILPSDRHKIHQGYKAINLSIAYLATFLMPKLALVDGYIGMEGNGPIGGTPIKLGLALGGRNAVAVDAATVALMGFDPRNIGYLSYLSEWGYGCIDPDKLRVVKVENWLSYRKSFRPHSSYKFQLNWRLTPQEKQKIEKELSDLLSWNRQ